MPGIYLDAISWPPVAEAMRAARAHGASELDSPRLLLSLTHDEAVRDAIARCGVSSETIERAVAAWPPHAARPVDALTIAPETWLVLHRAQSAAFAREHVTVEAGHVLLGMLADPASAGARLLAGTGADLAIIAAEIDRRLPGRPFDVERHREEAERHPRLSSEAIERLLEDLGEWHKALRSLRERRRAIAAGETPRVADEEVEDVRRHAREHAAWIALRDHHLHLAVAAADAHVPEHDFGFTYTIARDAMFLTCRRYDGPSTEADFLQAVQRAIDTALQRTFCEVARAT